MVWTQQLCFSRYPLPGTADGHTGATCRSFSFLCVICCCDGVSWRAQQGDSKAPSRVLDTIANIFGDYARTGDFSGRSSDDRDPALLSRRGGIREGGASTGRRSDGGFSSSHDREAGAAK